MSEQNLGITVIVQKENAEKLFSNNLLYSSEYTHNIDNEPVFIFTNEDAANILDTTEKHNKSINKLKELNEDHPIQKPSNYLTKDYIGNFYFASITVIGLYILFKMIKKTR